ncbi:hypothetical protein BCR42DRAFT_437166 [Absidia repens]|uniref:Uncharacterized protein n=1 Tax=Absidia repens TaxID=90262 RepID=A0A1X2II94_9FUNG|nr:hypothetical protein BCR42DRAFT_437166 [Absidia repens]
MQRNSEVFKLPHNRKPPLITFKRSKKTHNTTIIQKPIIGNASTTIWPANDTVLTQPTSSPTFEKNHTEFPGDNNTDFQVEFRKATSIPHSANNNSSKDRKTPAINTTTTSICTQPLDIRKRKRNLVSQLRYANGEIKDVNETNSGLDFTSFFLDSEENNIYGDQMNPTLATTTNNSNQHIPSIDIPTDFQDYHEQMEKVISELMVSEFGQDELEKEEEEEASSSSPPTLHQSYVPENNIKAPITYSRRNNNNQQAAAFDGIDMEQLIKYILYGDS